MVVADLFLTKSFKNIVQNFFMEVILMTNELMQMLKVIEEKIGKDWMKELDDVDSPEDLIEKADSYNIYLSQELAEEAYDLLFSQKELSEEELANIAGGFLDTGKDGDNGGGGGNDGGGDDDNGGGGPGSIKWT
jgi:bacteriocin-like protein